MATLNCEIVGENDTFVIVDIEASNAEKPNQSKSDADQLMLHLAKCNGTLLKDDGLEELTGGNLVEAPTSAMQNIPTQQHGAEASVALLKKRQEQWDKLNAGLLWATNQSSRTHKSGRKKRKSCSTNDPVNLELIRQVYGSLV